KMSRRYLYMAIQRSKQEQTAIENVNEVVANQDVFFVKLHEYQWHVHGRHIFTLHEKLEEHCKESNEYTDAFAERLITLGEKPYSTLGEYLDEATIQEKPYRKKLSAEEMVSNIVDDFHTLKSIANEGITSASASGDDSTEDMLIDYVDSI